MKGRLATKISLRKAIKRFVISIHFVTFAIVLCWGNCTLMIVTISVVLYWFMTVKNHYCWQRWPMPEDKSLCFYYYHSEWPGIYISWKQWLIPCFICIRRRSFVFLGGSMMTTISSKEIYWKVQLSSTVLLTYSVGEAHYQSWELWDS